MFWGGGMTTEIHGKQKLIEWRTSYRVIIKTLKSIESMLCQHHDKHNCK